MLCNYLWYLFLFFSALLIALVAILVDPVQVAVDTAVTLVQVAVETVAELVQVAVDPSCCAAAGAG